jgi:hypothetical protein
MASNPDIVTHPNSLAAIDPPPSPHLVPVLFPDTLSDDTEALFGQQIRYRDANNGKVMECSVEDCVTSRRRGKYYIVTYGEGLEEEVSEREMQEMLKNRVQ